LDRARPAPVEGALPMKWAIVLWIVVGLLWVGCIYVAWVVTK
jgi:hypothetical protein